MVNARTARKVTELAETLLAFGLPYAFEIAHFAVPDAGASFGQGEVLSGAYFLAHLLVAAALLLSGLLLLRRQPRQPV